MLKAVIFDLYETLVTHFDPDWKPPELTSADRLGMGEKEFQSHAVRLRDEWQMGHPLSHKDLLRAICIEAGHTPSESVIEQIALEQYETKVGVFEKIDPAVVELVEGLLSRGLRLGVITNAGDIDVEPWPRCRLAPLFEAFIASFQVGMLKPDPQIYEHGLHSLGVSAGEAVFVGDGGSDELAGATRVGFRAFWATWFLDRWPLDVRPQRFEGDGWRQSQEESPFPRLRTPNELLDEISNI